MKALLSNGGPLLENNGLFFIGILTLVLIVLVAWSLYFGLPTLRKDKEVLPPTKSKLKHLKSFGLFALVVGVLSQLLSLYSIFSAIEEAGDINLNIVLSALRASMVPMLFGISIYLLSIVLWLLFDLKIKGLNSQ